MEDRFYVGVKRYVLCLERRTGRQNADPYLHHRELGEHRNAEELAPGGGRHRIWQARLTGALGEPMQQFVGGPRV